MKKSYLFLAALYALNIPQIASAQCSMQVLQGPNIGCISDLQVNIPPSKSIVLYATDFLTYLEDDATPTSEIKIGIRRRGDGAGFPLDKGGNPVDRLIFDCDDIGVQPLELWAMNADGNTAFCETSVLIQDNVNNCGAGPGRVEACVWMACYPDIGIEDCSIRFEVTAPSMPPLEYTTVGVCGGINVPEDAEVTITPTKDIDPLNGISSLDLARISQFIEGAYPFSSPYQWIAADANNDQVIDSLDVLECRRLMLGIYTELPNNSAWRFVDKNYVFPSSNPLSEPFPESVTVNTGNLPPGPIEFLGIKICDVACSGLVGFYDPMPGDWSRIGLPQPNPTRAGALLPIHLVHHEILLLEILDLSGRLLFHTEIRVPAGSALLEIPAAALPQPGMYIWRVCTGKMVQAGKVVRE